MFKLVQQDISLFNLVHVWMKTHFHMYLGNVYGSVGHKIIQQFNKIAQLYTFTICQFNTRTRN